MNPPEGVRPESQNPLETGLLGVGSTACMGWKDSREEEGPDSEDKPL